MFSKLDARNKYDFSKLTPENEDMMLRKRFELCNLDELFSQTPNARILNNDSLISRKLSQEYRDAIYSNVDNELGFVPTCQCGNIRGAAFLGMICGKCGTECSSQFVNALSNSSWIGIPEGLPPVLHPVWYDILRSWTGVGTRRQTVIDIILNPEEDVPEDLFPYIKGRGFKYVSEHPDEVMDLLLRQYPKTAKKPLAKIMVEFYNRYKDCMFTRKLPVLHSSLHPLRSNGGGMNYVDVTSKEILPAVINMSDLTFKRHAVRMTEKQENRELYNIYVKISSYYRSLVKEKLSGKPGLLRKHCSGSRMHFSSRSVIVPHNEVLDFDEVVMPWGLMLNTLKLPIINILVHRKRYSPDAALTLFTNALAKYDPLIGECLDILINESPGGSLKFVIGRNPTLAYGSMLILRCRRYKTDPTDETMGINACVVGPMNADFDGDELYILWLPEMALVKALESTHPSQFVLSTNRPGLSDRIGLLKENGVTLEHYLDEDDQIDHFKIISKTGV